MGQKPTSGLLSPEPDDSPSLNSPRGRVHNKARKQMASGVDLENVGDLESILQAIGTSTPTPDNVFSDSPASPATEITQMEDTSANQDAIKTVVTARSKKLVRHISKSHPMIEGQVTMLRTSTMMTLLSFCDPHTQILIRFVNSYFNKLSRTARKSVDLLCRKGWVDALKASPFISEICLRAEPSREETERFCKMVRNDAFPELRVVKLVYVGDDALCDILSSLNTTITRSLRLAIIDNDFNCRLSFVIHVISQRFCNAYAQASQQSISKVLGGLVFRTNDVEGLEMFFKSVELFEYSRLETLDLTGCPLRRRGFEMLVRSLWSEAVPASSLPPIRTLKLSETHCVNSCAITLANIMERGGLSNLEVLDISSNKIQQSGMQCIINSLSNYSCPNLKEFIISSNNIGPNSLVPLFHAFSRGICPCLENLDISNTGIDLSDISALSLFLKSEFAEYLSRLSISNNPQVTPALPLLFSSLRESSVTHLKTLLLEGVSISIIELSMLCEWMVCGKASHLENLILKANLIDSESFLVLLETFTHPSCPKVRIIDFSSNLIGGFNETEFKRLLARDSVQSPAHSPVQAPGGEYMGVNSSATTSSSSVSSSSTTTTTLLTEQSRIQSVHSNNIDMPSTTPSSSSVAISSPSPSPSSNILSSPSFLSSPSTTHSPQPPTTVSDHSVQNDLVDNDSLNLLIRSPDSETRDFTHMPFAFTVVDFSFNPLTDADLRLLLMFYRQYSPIQYVSSIMLGSNMFGLSGIVEFFSSYPVDTPSYLTSLTIDSISITGVGRYFHNFFGTKICQNLRELQLRDCNLSVSDLRLLVDSLSDSSCNKLNVLRVNGNSELNDSFVEHFLSVYEHRSVLGNLYELDLSYSSVTVTGGELFIEYFASHPDCRLQRLDMTYCQFDKHEKKMLSQKFKDVYNGKVYL